jgi:hypothetical protein
MESDDAPDDPGPVLAAQIAAGTLASDINFIWPGQPLPAEFSSLPPAWTRKATAQPRIESPRILRRLLRLRMEPS